MKHTVIINKRTGEISWLTPPPFKMATESQRVQRFSEIVPSSRIPRIAFRILRKLFGERGKVAAWTRSWVVMWTGRILIGPHTGDTFESGIRDAVIQWEHEKFAQQRHEVDKVI